jgi:hypothetical protein
MHLKKLCSLHCAKIFKSYILHLKPPTVIAASDISFWLANNDIRYATVKTNYFIKLAFYYFNHGRGAVKHIENRFLAYIMLRDLLTQKCAQKKGY